MRGSYTALPLGNRPSLPFEPREPITSPTRPGRTRTTAFLTSPVRALVLFNPIAGAGRARAAASRLAGELEAGGHRCRLVETQPGLDRSWLDEAMAEAVDLAVVTGGDGAVRLVARACAERGLPLWQCPLGTENLFARQWGMAKGAGPLLRAWEAGVVRACDLGVAGGECFTLMASVGFDADVVHDLAAHRRGGISHLSYVLPIVRSAVRSRPARLRVDVDGHRLDTGEPGFVVVANSRQYALRIDPVPQADPTDGLLDVGWFPCASLLGVAWWSLRCWMRCQGRGPRMRTGRGRHIRIEAEQPLRYQLDGDAAGRPQDGASGAAVRRLELEVLATRLPILCGAEWRPPRPGADRDLGEHPR